MMEIEVVNFGHLSFFIYTCTINQKQLKIMTTLQEKRIERGKSYNIAVQWLKDEKNKDHEDYKLVKILVGEFYLSYKVQNELYFKCIELGLIKTPEQ